MAVSAAPPRLPFLSVLLLHILSTCNVSLDRPHNLDPQICTFSQANSTLFSGESTRGAHVTLQAAHDCQPTIQCFPRPTADRLPLCHGCARVTGPAHEVKGPHSRAELRTLPRTTMEAVARPAATCWPTKLSSVESGAIWEDWPRRSPTTSTAVGTIREIRLKLHLKIYLTLLVATSLSLPHEILKISVAICTHLETDSFNGCQFPPYTVCVRSQKIMSC